MKPLFDEMLPDRLLRLLADLFPDAEHVNRLRLTSTDDLIVREFASAGGFALVTKDRDHRDMAVRLGIPPKVVWVRLGNSSAGRVADAMRAQHGLLLAFDADPVAAIYELN
jgi:predicted nuclease of predicted toxin-antitoxin system